MDAQYESFIFSYEDYKESNVRRNRLASSSRITMTISTSDSRKALRNSQQVRTRHRVGPDAITEVDDCSDLEKGYFLRKVGSLF